MENVIAKRAKNIKLTKAQQKIAEYFIQNPEQVGISSSMEVAKIIGVSDASITRFARAIGYEGFSDLKNDIYSNLAMQATGGTNSLSLTERLDQSDMDYGHDNSMLEFLKITEYNLERTFKQNKIEQFENAANIIVQAKHRYVVGFRGCVGCAMQFSYITRVALDHIICITDEGPGSISMLQGISENDCMLLFSLSRIYTIDLQLAKLAKERGAKLCLITNSPLSPINELADELIIVESKRVSYFNTVSSVNMASEYLMTQIARARTDFVRERAIERDELTKELRL